MAYKNKKQGFLYPALKLHDLHTVDFYKRYLIMLVKSNFGIDGCPDDWDYDYLQTAVIMENAVIYPDPEFGVIPQRCTTTGFNVFGRPLRCIVTNPAMHGSRDIQLGDDAFLCYLTPDMKGISDAINFYASRMALASESADVSVYNSKIANIISASDSNTAASIEAMFDDIGEGKPHVVIRKGSFDPATDIQMLLANPQQSFITDKLLSAQMDLLNQFKDQLGINHPPLFKKANIHNAELENSNEQTNNQLHYYVEILNRCFEQVNKRFGLKLHAYCMRDCDCGTANNDLLEGGDAE